MNRILLNALAVGTVVFAAPAIAAVPANSSFTTMPGAIAAPMGATTVIAFNGAEDTPVGPGGTAAETAAKGIEYFRSGDAGRMPATGISPHGYYADGQTYTFQAPSPQTGGFYGVGGLTGTAYQQVGSVASSATFLGTPQNTGFSDISVFIGSLNSFNVVKLFFTGSNDAETYNGLQINNNVDPNSTVNTRVSFKALNGKTFSGIQFYNNAGSNGSLEFDNLAFTTAVPEPATWAMMLVGFAMVGAASRYRRRATAVTA